MNAVKLDLRGHYFFGGDSTEVPADISGDQAAVRLIGLLRQASGLGSCEAFDAFMRCHGPEMIGLVNIARHVEPGEASKPAESWRKLGRHLRERGVDEGLVDYFEHGQRVFRDVSMPDDVDLANEQVQYHLSELGVAEWQWRLCSILVQLVAQDVIAKDAPGVTHAISMSVDKARSFAGHAYAIDAIGAEQALN